MAYDTSHFESVMTAGAHVRLRSARRRYDNDHPPYGATGMRPREGFTLYRDGSVAEEGGLYITTPRAARTGAARYADDTRVFVIERATGRASWFRYTDGGWERAF